MSCHEPFGALELWTIPNPSQIQSNPPTLIQTSSPQIPNPKSHKPSEDICKNKRADKDGQEISFKNPNLIEGYPPINIYVSLHFHF
jgi:hypothetical protein